MSYSNCKKDGETVLVFLGKYLILELFHMLQPIVSLGVFDNLNICL